MNEPREEAEFTDAITMLALEHLLGGLPSWTL